MEFLISIHAFYEFSHGWLLLLRYFSNIMCAHFLYFHLVIFKKHNDWEFSIIMFSLGFSVNPFMLTHRIRRNLSSSFVKINSVGIRKRKKIIFSEKKLKTANWQTAFVFWFFVVYTHIFWYKQMLLSFLESCYCEKVHTFFRLKLSWKL